MEALSYYQENSPPKLANLSQVPLPNLSVRCQKSTERKYQKQGKGYGLHTKRTSHLGEMTKEEKITEERKEKDQDLNQDQDQGIIDIAMTTIAIRSEAIGTTTDINYCSKNPNSKCITSVASIHSTFNLLGVTYPCVIVNVKLKCKIISLLACYHTVITIVIASGHSLSYSTAIYVKFTI